jgi:hypothetical protein
VSDIIMEVVRHGRKREVGGREMQRARPSIGDIKEDTNSKIETHHRLLWFRDPIRIFFFFYVFFFLFPLLFIFFLFFFILLFYSSFLYIFLPTGLRNYFRSRHGGVAG